MTWVNCTDRELCTYLQALGEGYLPTSSSVTNASAPSKSITIASKSWKSGSKTGSFPGFQLQMTCESSTADHGESALMPSRPGSLAVHSRAQPEGETPSSPSGPRRHGSSGKQGRLMFSSRTSPVACPTCDWCAMTSGQWVTASARWPLLPPPPWVRRTLGDDGGYLATPTATANQGCPSMRIWPGCARLQSIFGGVTPDLWDWMMGFPAGWSDLQPLAMHKYRQWLELHGSC